MRGIGSFYTVLEEETRTEYTLRAQKKLRHQKMTPMVGDHVLFTAGSGEEDGWIESILPRKSALKRPSVANVDVLMLVVAPAPAPDLSLVDKLILFAAQGGMQPALCINKMDLRSDLPNQIEEEYKGTELRIYRVSARTGEGIDQLRCELAGKVTCFAGQSAVGKSSLLNALFGLSLETGGLSRKTDRGRHTTRRCELMERDGVFVLDTPGFSLLDLDEKMAPETLSKLYPEYEALEPACRFHPCMHDREPGCAVRASVEAGNLSAERWERYRLLLTEARQNWKGRYE